MPNFSYKAIGRDGKEKKGKMEAGDREEVLAYIKGMNLVPVDVAELNALNSDIKISAFEKNPTPRDMAIFCRQFVSISNAGVPIATAFEMLSEQTENKILKAAIAECRQSIQSGSSLATAMSKYPRIFPNYFLTMVSAGEVSGNLDTSFERMAEQFEKEAKIKAAVKKATVYPVFVLVIAFIAILVMLGYVVPQFQGIFDSIGTGLPGLTLWVIAASNFVKESWMVIAIFIIAVIIVAKYYGTLKSGKYFYSTIALKIPLVNNLIIKSASARVTRTLATLLASGISITEALTIVEDVVDNMHFKDAIRNTKKEVSLGVPMSTPIEMSGMFPPMVYHMMKIGEEVGDVEKMLDKTAEYYEEEVEMAVAGLMSALEPAIILLLALVVGVIVLSLVLPMGKMIGDLSNI